MKKDLFPRILSWMALGVFAAGSLVWIAGGARLGWTQTSVIVMQHDEITGIHYPVREPSFRPGVEVPLLAIATAAVLAGIGYVARGRSQSRTTARVFPSHLQHPISMKTHHIPYVRTFGFLALIAIVLALAAAGRAAPQNFNFKDPKGVNNVQFKLDAPLESITGTATGISGTIEFDAAQPQNTRGRIVLEAASLTVGNPLMGEHLRSDQWLDVATHPTIVFDASTAKNVRQRGAEVLADVTGKLTLKGVTKEVTVPVSFTYLADKAGARVNDPKVKGDLLVLRSTFEINRSDFDLQRGQMTDNVAETISLSLRIAGAAPRA
jgi:polyisoprenoid-binding protein YceI